MKQPFLERRSPLRVSYALFILMAFFFILPSVFRAARLSLGEKQNEVKDWLPSDFPETAELEWFADHFIGESFVLATWPGCTSGDQRLQLFEQKLRHESDRYDPAADLPPELQDEYARAKKLGKELSLLNTGREHDNWGEIDEKWVRSANGTWYYITPEGKLYRWDEAMTGPATFFRSLKRAAGTFQLEGQFVAKFGEPSTPESTNRFYKDPSLICAPLFHTVETGDSIAKELSSKGGSLWPIDLTDESLRPIVARRRALERLTGTLFASAIPHEFDWTPEAFRSRLSSQQRETLPENFDFIVEKNLNEILEEHFEGSLKALQSSSNDDQTSAWYAIFDAADVEPPPRLTCVVVTLTDLAKDHLPYVLGRGVAGGPKGRLLQLAADSGIQPASPPSVAPPPFDREPPESIAGMPPLRIGGPPVDNLAIDEEGTITLIRLLGYSLLIGIGLSYACFRSIKITTMVFVVGGASAMLSMAMVWWTGGKVDAILMSMPSLVYVLGLSGAIHVVNYYRDEVRARGQRGAAGRALRHAILPCTLASFTTAIGLASLVMSNLAPISNFGFYSAVGVMVTLGILFSYLPAALQTFPPAMEPNFEKNEQTSLPSNASTESPFAEWWASMGRWITGHHAVVSIACFAVLLIGSLGLRHIKTTVQLLKLFDSDSRIIRDYAWLEDNFGKLVPMEMIIRIPSEAIAESSNNGGTVPKKQSLATAVHSGVSDEPQSQPLSILERAEVVSRVGIVVRRTLGETGMGVVGQTMGADTFLPPLPEPSNSYNAIRSKFNRELIESRDQLLASDYVHLEKAGLFKGSELWRISLRVGALSDVDYGHFISTLRTAVEPVMRAYDAREMILTSLKLDVDGKPIALTGKERIALIGASPPKSLATAKLMKDSETIDTRSIFLSTLRELIANEPVRTPVWVDYRAEDFSIEVGSKAWDAEVAKYDAVIWVGQGEVDNKAVASAKRVIDANEIASKQIVPTLTSDRMPNVEGSGSLQAIYTGVIPVVYKAQRTLLYSLLESIALAFVLIAGVMAMLLNPGRMPWSWAKPANLFDGAMAGLVAMIPNVFPVLLVFGVMCHLGIAIDIGTMMTASVAMGVAVDDTIHFLSWFRENLDRGLSRVDAVIETYRRVGPAMTQTTIVGGLGLFVFALSTFTPTQRFGTLMLMMLAAALVGDLILLPALLAGPLGRWFKPRPRAPESSEENADRDAHEEVAESESISDDEMVERLRAQSTSDVSIHQHDGIPRLKVHFPPESVNDEPRRLKKGK